MGSLWVGLMSGTSADAVDAALVRLEAEPFGVELVAFASLPFEAALRERIHGLATGNVDLRELARLDVELGERFARAALEVVHKASADPAQITGIGSHGQTVGHFPEPSVRATLQLGDASVIHARTGWPVVSDFRRADMAAGGQGAPLTPLFHYLAFARRDETRCVLNVGGFTNVTLLPGDALDRVLAFDPGPGNALIDRAVRSASGGEEAFDLDGARARRGRVDRAVLEDLLTEPYFAAPPPKSTGHERFGAAFFERARQAVVAGGGSADDVVATLTALSVESVRRAAERFFPAPVQRWILCGGGAHNPTLVEQLRDALAPAVVETSDAHGVPTDALEAMAFAVLGWLSSRGEPGNVPGATGAAGPVVLGARTPPATG